MEDRILAIGASGKFAGLVIPALAARGANVRGLIRKPEEAAGVRAHGAAEAVVGDITDSASIERALDGVTSVFYIAPAFLPDEAKVGKAVVSSAIKAGVKRWVFSSVIHPVLSGLTNHAAKAAVEDAVLNSNLEYSFLHPAMFFQNFAEGWDRVRSSGVHAEPWSPETRFSRVDYRDVAEVAAIALTEDRLLYGTFELCADGWLNRHDVARVMGEVLGRDIQAKSIDPATLGDAATPMGPMFAHYDHYGIRGNALTLAAILGREPRSIKAYFGELAS